LNLSHAPGTAGCSNIFYVLYTNALSLLPIESIRGAYATFEWRHTTRDSNKNNSRNGHNEDYQMGISIGGGGD